MFARIKNENNFLENHNTHDLPSKQQIFDLLENCRDEAICLADSVGIYVDYDNAYFLFNCSLPPLEVKPSKKIVDSHTNMEKKRIMIHSLFLKNYAHKIPSEGLNECSPYAAVDCSNGKRVIVRKTSLCWLLRKSHVKLSSDRIYRVRTPYDNENIIKTK